MQTVFRTGEANARFGTSSVRHRIARGHWQPPCRGVVVTHSGPLGEDEKDLVALAAAARGAALSGATAATLDGLQGFATDQRFVTVPIGAKEVQAAGVTTHWSRELSDLDVHPSREPRRTRLARSVLDLASWSRHERFARWVVIAALQQGLVGVRQLREALVRRGPCRHRGVIVQSVLDAAGGIQSLPERDFDTIRRVLGLPPPTRQRPVRRTDGRYYLDVWWEQLGFGIEIHGIPHLAVERWDADLVRANEVVIAGDRLLTFSSYAIRHQVMAVADQLVRMARLHGWPGEPDLSTLASLERRKGRYTGRRPARG